MFSLATLRFQERGFADERLGFFDAGREAEFLTVPFLTERRLERAGVFTGSGSRVAVRVRAFLSARRSSKASLCSAMTCAADE